MFLHAARDQVTKGAGILPPPGPGDLAGTIGRTALDVLLPVRDLPRVKARSRKNPTSKYGPNAGQHPKTTQTYAIHTEITFFEAGLANRPRR
jgi:hypothetical protein